MKSRLIEQARLERRRRELLATPQERSRLALAAGRRLTNLYAAQHDISVQEARRRMAREGARGRRLCSWQRDT